MDIEYVKPTATKTAIPEKVVLLPKGDTFVSVPLDKNPDGDGYKLTSALTTKILALPTQTDDGLPHKPKKKINAEYVMTVMHSSKRRAQEVLDKLYAEGKLKTYSERYNELYPSVTEEI